MSTGVEQTSSPEPVAAEASEADNMATEMSAVFDKITAEDSSGRVPNEGQIASLNDHSVRETPANESEAKSAEQSVSEVKPPQSLNAKAREHWGSLPKEMQEYVSQRETDAQRRISELGHEAKAARTINSIIDNYSARLPEHDRQIPREKHIELLYAANEALLANPARAIQWLAQAHNVDLAQLATPVDPISQARQQERAAMQAELQRYHQQQQAALAQQMTGYLEKFAAEKPYWSQIENEILYHVTALRGTDPDMDYRDVLKAAVDRALKDNPGADKTNAQKQKAEARKKADEAKRLASLNVRSVVGKITYTPKGSLAGEAMSQVMSGIYDDIQARG
jgi:hypothetical protein